MNGFMNKWRQYEQKYNTLHIHRESQFRKHFKTFLVVPDNTFEAKKGKQMTSPHHPIDERSG